MNVSFIHVSKSFGQAVVVDDLTLLTDDGEFVVLLGPSGCGKTTTLRMLAGLEEAGAGDILIGDERVNDVPTQRRDIAMVFQSYALYPHMTIAENIAYPLRVRKIARGEIERRVAQVAGMLEIDRLLARRPRELSGGERQRVALARAVVRSPRVYLMDEPLSNLDAKLRVEMRAEIARLQRELGVTTIYVTHDQVEAMTLGDRVAIMRDGVLQQFAGPQDLYDRPRNLFVAEFIGSPAMNLVAADLARSNGDLVARFGDNSLRVGERVTSSRPALRGFEGRRVILGVRPEDIEDAAFGDGERMRAVVDIREDMGSEVFVHFGVGAKAVIGEDVRAAVGDEAAEVKGSTWVARLDRDTNAAEQARIDLVVDTNRLHFFDPETGDAIYD